MGDVRRTVQAMHVDAGRSYERLAGTTHVALWDLDLAAYMLLEGFPLIDAWKEGREFRIVFDDPANRIKATHLAFLQSEAGQFASAVKRLKKTVYSLGERRDR